MDISGAAIRPPGFRVSCTAVPPAALQESTRPGADRCYGIDLYCHHPGPAEFADHVIDAVLYGNCVDENTDEHARLGRALRTAAIAKFTPVPTAPPTGPTSAWAAAARPEPSRPARLGV